jgi:pimeloyl-ACP methyl ester carboxylesterase
MPALTRDGVKLHYDEAGRGDPALVFVHGWCCDRSYFAPQFEHFAATHRVISLDLRGHGKSDQPVDGYTIAGFADDIAWMCGELELTAPVIAGHSMGGAIALSLAARYPSVARAIIMLDGAGFFPDALHTQLPALTAMIAAPDGPEVMKPFLDAAMFIASDDPGRKERIIAAMTATPHRIMVAEWESLGEHDSPADARACTVPAMYVAASNGVGDMAVLRACIPTLVYAQTAAAGHFHQLEVPDQVNAMIERFLATSCG